MKYICCHLHYVSSDTKKASPKYKDIMEKESSLINLNSFINIEWEHVLMKSIW